MNRSFTMALVLVVFGAPAADAQGVGDRRGPYVDAGVVSDLDFNTYSDSQYNRPAAAVGVGTSLGRSWTVRFEAVVPAWHEATFSDSSGCSCSGRNASFTTAGRKSHRMMTYGVLVGRVFGIGRRVQLTPVFGFGVADHADREESTITIRDIGAVTTTPVSTRSNEALFTVVFGTDVGVQVSRRIAVVPQIRIHGVSGGEWLPIFRTGVAMRVTL